MRDGAQFMRELRTPWLAVPAITTSARRGIRIHRLTRSDSLAGAGTSVTIAGRATSRDGGSSVSIRCWSARATTRRRDSSRWLDEVSSSANGAACVVHAPAALHRHPAEGDMGYWSVKRRAAGELSRAHPRDDVADRRRRTTCTSGAIIASTVAATIWGASSGFLVGPDNQPELPGEKRLAVRSSIHRDRRRDAHEYLSGLCEYWIDDVLHEVYPPRGAA
jgi:hypothetical protein